MSNRTPLPAMFNQGLPKTPHTDYWQGDDISGDKQNHHIRLMFHNVNGLPIRGQEGFEMFVNEQIAMEVDIQCVTEHCLDTTKFQVYNELQEITKKTYEGTSLLQFNSSSETALNVYKPGGTGILALGNLVGRLEPQGRGGDSMGRWSFIHLRRSNKPPVTIVSAYQVCPRPTNIIGNTAYHQQKRALNAKGKSTMHPRQAFIQDLSNFLAKLRQQGHDIILGGDFNEALTDKNSGILRMITSNNLTDPFLTKFSSLPTFGTHLSGTRRIDSVFMSPALLNGLRKVGYAPFQYAKHSDHRPVLIEMDSDILFGRRSDPSQNSKGRLIKSKDKRNVTTFIQTWYDEISKRRGFLHMQAINEDLATPNVVEMVDEIIGISGDLAERACKRRRPTYFSQQIVQDRIRVSILKGHLNSLQLNVDRRPTLMKRMTRLGVQVSLPLTAKLTREALRAAKKQLLHTSHQSAEVRQAELDAKINAEAARKNKSKETILRSIKKVEGHKKTYQILRGMRMRTTEIQRIDRLEIPASWPSPGSDIEVTPILEDPKTCTQWKWITNPTEVEYYLLLRNRLHFGQAEGTPFTEPPLHEDLNWTASSEAAEAILRGEYSHSITTPNCRDLLQACAKTAQGDDLPSEIKLEDFRGKIKAWKEATTTSPSGRHLGRYKALFAQGTPETEEEESGERSLSEKQAAITSLLLAIINYCIRNTYVLDRWKTIVNIMIFKEQGNFKIHRLRVIHIYEADFNLLLAIKWRQLLRQADASEMINEGQYGGRPGCEAQSLPLLEELKYDLSYLTRRTLFNFDNDATSCYDRIVLPLASLVNRKYGLHRSVVALHASTLQTARFYLKTAAGLSQASYSPSPRSPIHGTGQGSGNSPCIWLFISSTLFDIHKSASQGAQFVSPDGKQSVKLSMVGFVDDSTGTCNDFQPQTEGSIDHLLSLMEKDAQLWSNLLYCSGGKLELPKCSFHVLRFEFRPNGLPIPSIDNYENRIHIRDLETDEKISIQSKRPFETHKTLGHFKSPTSKPTTELRNIHSKAERVALLIATSPISRGGAYLAYRTVYLPTIAYTLPQSFFSRQDLDRMQAASMSKIIAKCGYNRHTARALLYAPMNVAGGGFLPWYLLQGEGQVKQFIKHWRTNTLISNTLRITLQWAQWQAGLARSLLEDTSTPLPYLECRWITSLRTFLQQIQSRILVDSPIVQPLERRRDLHIMQYASDSGMFDHHELHILNCCRLYLHVTTVSEMFNADGTKIIPALFNCQREPWFNPDTFIALQQRPSEFQIRTKWQKLCRQWSLDSGDLAASMNLGEWSCLGHQLRRRRQTYFESSTNTVYHWNQNAYWKCSRIHGVPHTYKLSQPTNWKPLSPCTPIDATTRAGNYLVIPHRPAQEYPPPNAPGNTLSFAQYINTLTDWEKYVLQDAQLLMEPTRICLEATSLNSGSRLLLVSDGSLRFSCNSYGWVFGSDDKVIYAEGSGIGSGEMTSHRAEGWGMLSGAVFVHHLYKFLGMTDQHFMHKIPLTIVSDNNSLVQRITARRQYATNYPTATLAVDWDLIEQIHHTIQATNLTTVAVEWVKGHQDLSDPNLSVEAAFNIRADELAGSVTPPAIIPLSSPLLPHERCRLLLNNQAIQGNYAKAIRSAYSLPSFYCYLEQRHRWSPEQRQQVDWSTLSRAITSLEYSSVQILKLVHDKLPTNYEISKSNRHHPGRCTYCDARETFHHLITCSNPLSQAFRRHLKDTVSNYLTLRDAPNLFTMAFNLALSLSLQETITYNIDGHPPRVNQCIRSQISLGLPLLLKGFLSLEWRTLATTSQDQEKQNLEPLETKLMAGLVSHILHAQYEFWLEHQRETSKSDPNTSEIPRTLKLATHIRYLHSKRHECLHGHRSQYFFDDVEAFLSQATTHQMKQYLHHYEPSINTSIQAAQANPIRSIFTFPGFLHRSRTTNVNAPGPRLPNELYTGRNLTDSRGAQIIRKHSRWKDSTQKLTSFWNYVRRPPE